MGAHMMTSRVGVTLNITPKSVELVIEIMLDNTKKDPVVQRAHMAWPQDWTARDDTATTAVVAAWALQHILKWTFIQTPYPGIQGARQATSESLGRAVFAYAGLEEPTHNKTKHYSHNEQCNVYFGKNTVVVATRHESIRIRLPENIQHCWFDETFGYTDHASSMNATCLEHILVDLCRAAEHLTTPDGR